MCISPDEMTSAQLEAEIAGLTRYVEEERSQVAWVREYYKARIKTLEAYLKERAEAGTY